MTGEKKSSDISSRLSVKRGGKLISKTLGKSASPPTISPPPKAAVSASKVKKDEVQRRKNSFHDMLRGAPREKDGGRSASSIIVESASSTPRTPQSPSDNTAPSNVTATPMPTQAKVAELEKALAAAQIESVTLRQELERVKQDAQASVEVSKYQAAEAQQIPTSDNILVHMEMENKALTHENHDLRFRIVELQDRLIAQSAPRPLHNDADWDVLTLRLHETEKESHSRLQQLLSLKSSISSLTRTDSQVSDSELADSFTQLANRVREWVVSSYRRTKMNLDNLPHTTVTTLKSIKINYKDIDGTDKLALYQAIVSRNLMRIFDEPVVVGMPDQGIYTGLRAFSEGSQRVGAELQEWRRSTIQVIEKGAQATTLLNWKDQEFELLAGEIEGVMLSISSVGLTSSARSALIGIMNTAADLRRTLCLQKAEYCVGFYDTLDGKHHCFDDQAMEPVNDPEYAMDEGSEPNIQREFAFCVCPYLEKFGTDASHIVFKARVCCGVG